MLSTVNDDEREIIERARPYTMVSDERLVACVDAAAHIVRGGVQGALVECGVWKGGSILAMVLTLQRLGATDRDIFLFDTFQGMTEPTEADTSDWDGSALATWRESHTSSRKPWDWLFRNDVFNLSDVKKVIYGTGYPRERIRFVVGRVEETVPSEAPETIALLRLDTDWYESTKHELVHLYPRLSSGGVLIVDDYGHWEGCRRAVDEYFAESARPILLSRSDYTGRMGVKR